jgi:hypothetical protein
MIVTFIAAILSGIFYRMGGSGNYSRLWRVLGCPLLFLCAYLTLCGLNWGIWWAYVLTYGLSCGAISAYWGQDEKPFGYWAHGLGLSLACLPLAIATGYWGAFGIHALLLTSGICFWSEYTSWDILEEVGRGIIYILTTFIFLLQF